MGKQTTEIATIDVARVTVQKNNGIEYILDTASKIDVSPQTEEQKAVSLIVKGVLRAQKRAQTTLLGNEIKLTDNVFSPELVEIIQGGEILYGNSEFAAGVDKLEIGTKNPDTPVTVTIIAPTTSSSTLSVLATSNDISINLATSSSSMVTSTANDVKAAIEASTSVSALITCTVSGTGTGIVEAAAKTTISTAVVGYNPPTVGSNTTSNETFTLKAYSAQYDVSGNIVQYECIEYPNCQGKPISLSSEDGKFRAPEYTITSAPAQGERPYSISYMKSLPDVAA